VHIKKPRTTSILRMIARKSDQVDVLSVND
jgi:hypothetical protein